MDYGVLFHFVLGIFNVSGMSPVDVHSPQTTNQSNQHRTRNVLLTTWSLINLIALCILTVIVFKSDQYFLPHNYIGEFNDMIKTASLFLTHFIILVEGFLSRHQLFQFWQKIHEVDTKHLTRLEIVHVENSNKFRRKFVSKFFVNVIAMMLFEIIIIASVQDDATWAELWYLTIVSLTISRLRHLHLMLHVDTISFRLKLIRKELEKVVERRESEVKDRRGFHKLCVMKTIYNVLYECCTHLNFSFGFSQLCNLMQNFVQLTCDLYWIYSILYRNDLTYIFVLILHLVPTFQVVIVTLSSCEKCLREVREIGFLLHNVEKDGNDPSMDTLIENFSLQIHHEPFYISVTGFFNMDFTLLKAMVAAITTYMVIFIQFMPKEDPTKTVPHGASNITQIILNETTTLAPNMTSTR